MSGRITQLMTSRAILADLQAVNNQMDRTQRKLSSGKELTRPSDNPFAVARALDYRSELSANVKHQDNVAEANAWQTITDVALSGIGDMARRVQDLLVQASNDTIGAAGRNAIALEVETIVDSIKSEANAQYAGRYVFSGSATLTPPYTPAGADTFNGNAEAINRQIGPSVQIHVNSSAATVIGDGTTGLIGVAPPGCSKSLRQRRRRPARHRYRRNERSERGAHQRAGRRRRPARSGSRPPRAVSQKSRAPPSGSCPRPKTPM